MLMRFIIIFAGIFWNKCMLRADDNSGAYKIHEAPLKLPVDCSKIHNCHLNNSRKNWINLKKIYIAIFPSKSGKCD